MPPRPETRLGELAVARRPHDAVFADFVAVYYDALPEDDVGEHDIDDLYAAAAAHYDLGRVRRRGVPLVRVSTPERDGDAWSATHSGVLAVTDDMPFLVDTMRMLLERHGLDIHLLVHPMLAVERDDDGALVSVGAVDTAGTEDDRRPRAGCSRRGPSWRSTASTAPSPTSSRPSSSSRSPTSAAWSPTSSRCGIGCRR